MSKSNTPYELRFQIFEAAKQTLVEEYWAADSRRRLMLEGVEPVDPNTSPDHPEYPTLQDVIHMTKRINVFVSHG